MSWTALAIHIFLAGTAFAALGVILAHFVLQYPPGETPSPLYAAPVSIILFGFLVADAAAVFARN